MKSEQSWRNIIGQSVVKWRILTRPVLQILLCVSFLETRMSICSGYREDSYYMRVYDLLRGKRVAGGWSEKPTFSCYFLKLLQLKIFNMARGHIWG